MDRLNSRRFPLVNLPPTSNDISLAIQNFVVTDSRTFKAINNLIVPVIRGIDGSALSKNECKWGQIHPEDCQSGACKRSRWPTCWDKSKEYIPTMIATKRNVYGVLLPIKPGEKMDPVQLSWSALNEIIDRLGSPLRTKCATCNTPIIEGFDIKGAKLERTVRLQVNKGVKYKHRTDKMYFCSDACRRIKRTSHPIQKCRRCGRIFVVDTASMDGTNLCFHCLKEYVLKYGLRNDKAELVEGPRSGSMWSFAIRGISMREAVKAGFNMKLDPLRLDTDRKRMEQATYVPTWKGVYVRFNSHSFMLALPKSFRKFTSEKGRPRS